MYYQNIHADPKHPDTVYVPNVQTQVSDDGGTHVRRRRRAQQARRQPLRTGSIPTTPTTCSTAATAASTKPGIAASSGNTSPISRSRSSTTSTSTTRRPSTTCTAARRTTPRSAARPVRAASTAPPNADWFVVTGGDGFVARIDPTDPNIVYGESQYGGIVRLIARNQRARHHQATSKAKANRRSASTGNRRSSSAPTVRRASISERINFCAPTTAATPGARWAEISPARSIATSSPSWAKSGLPKPFEKHQSTSTYGNITALSESRKRKASSTSAPTTETLQVLDDDGANWRKSREIPHPSGPTAPYGVYVQRLLASTPRRGYRLRTL